MTDVLFTQALLQIVLPVWVIRDLFMDRSPSLTAWARKTLLYGLLLLFAFLTARWDLTSLYLRLAIFPFFFLGAALAWRRIPRVEIRTGQASRPAGIVMECVIVLLLIVLNAAVLSGLKRPENMLDLSFPLRDGTYYIGGGGSSRWVNNHHAYPPQDYALDILRLNRAGARATGWWPSEPARYSIFGSPVYSPCRGTVILAVDGFPDHAPPRKDPEHPAGNHVVIDYDGVEILLAHLQQGSVAVGTGDVVTTSTRIGKVGNSGNSTQPHLHVHAERGGNPGTILDGEGVGITFDGRFLVRNAILREP